MSAMSFSWPLAFLLLPLPWLLRSYTAGVEQGLAGALKVPFYKQYFAHPARGGMRSAARWRAVVAWAIWLSLLTALARPVSYGEPVALPAKGRDLMLAIDLSGSMEQRDIALAGRAASRLDVVKAAAADFISRRAGDKLGLVLFSDRAYLQAPLTFDRAVVEALLDQAQVGLTGQKTAIGDAIAVSLKRLKDQPAQSRVLVLLTDGENNAGVMAPLQAAELAQKLGVRIYTVGVGAAPQAVQSPFGQQWINLAQDLDEGTLTALADMTGGQYFRATDAAALAAIYRQIDQLEPAAGPAQFTRPERALFYLPAALALCLAALLAISFLPRPHRAHREV